MVQSKKSSLANVYIYDTEGVVFAKIFRSARWNDWRVTWLNMGATRAGYETKEAAITAAYYEMGHHGH